MQCREVRIVIYCVTSTKLLTTRGVTLRHPLFSVRLVFTVMHVIVAEGDCDIGWRRRTRGGRNL